MSRDGRWIAFVDGSPGDIHVIGRDGRTAHRITDHPAADYYPVWSPDGRHLAFLSDRGGGAGLWTVAIRDGQPSAEPMRIKDGMQGVYPVLGWTTRGLAYAQYQTTQDIYTVPVNPVSGEPNGSPRLIPYRRTGHNIEPEWSPDGKYLAFVSSFEPDRRAVVLLPSDGGEPREFPTPAVRLWDLRWFGDSRGLGITGHDARGERMLFRLTLATGEWKNFPLPFGDPGLQWNGMHFEWNADGTRYFYVWQDSWPGSYVAVVERDLQSDRERVVFQTRAQVPNKYRGLRFSPDRRMLAFRGLGDQQRIVVLTIETGETRVLHDKANGDTYSYTDTDSLAEPTWSPDGRALLVHRTENPRTDKQTTVLRLIPIDGGDVQRIAPGAELERLLAARRGAARPTVSTLAWSPDGSNVALVLTASQVETFVIENPLARAGAADASARR
ncbi:MAG: TolB family protein [Gammaproteobacteria bacterium]